MEKSSENPMSDNDVNKTLIVDSQNISNKISSDIFAGEAESSTPNMLTPESLPGQMLGRCLVHDVIGKGGMGVVFKGQHSTLNIPVAIKVLFPKYASINEYAQRFIREAQIAAAINHPSIVRVFDCGEENGFLYIVQEFIDGGDLLHKLRIIKHFDNDTLLDIGLAISAGLVEAERNNIVHRDIKPQNIMIKNESSYKLADLGIAKLHTIDSDNTLTQSNSCMGTPLYMSPEQSVDAKKSDIRSDIYSLGCSLFHLGAGHPPYEGSNWQETLSKHVLAPTPSLLKEYQNNISHSLATIIQKCMAKKPNERYNSASSLVEAFMQAKQDSQNPADEANNRSFVKIGKPSISATKSIIADNVNTTLDTTALSFSPDSCASCGRTPIVSSSLRYQCTEPQCNHKLCIDCWLRNGIRYCSLHKK